MYLHDCSKISCEEALQEKIPNSLRNSLGEVRIYYFLRNLFHLCLHSKSNFHYGPSCNIISKAWLCMSSVGFFTMRSVFFLYLKGSQCNGKKLFLSLHHLFFWSCIFTIRYFFIFFYSF